MKFRQLALNNVRGGFQRYLAYFMSSAFSVMVFYLYASLYYHPEVQQQMTGGGTARALAEGLVICEYIVVIFSFVFILYSTTAFLRSRKKEFGLLTLLGAEQKQVRAVVFMESMITALFALVCGLGLGMLFSKLFFMALSVILSLPNPVYFTVPLRALGLTTALYVVLFAGINVLSLVQIRQSSVLELLKAHRQPRVFSRHYWSLLILGITLLVMGYRMALRMHTGRIALETMMATVFLVVLGTYFLFSQGMPMLVRLLKSRPKLYLRGINVVSLNRIYFRLKDNSNLMFSMAVLVAVIVTALGTSNTILQNARSMALEELPYAVSFIRPGDIDRLSIQERVETIIREQSLVLSHSSAIPAIKMRLSHNKGQDLNVNVIANSDYNYLALGNPELDSVTLSGSEMVLFTPFRVIELSYLNNYIGMTGELKMGDSAIFDSVTIKDAKPVSAMRGHYTLVVSDAAHAVINREAQSADRLSIFSFDYAGWERSSEVVKKIREARLAPEGLNSRVDTYQAYKASSSAVLFIGMFISFLFFLASGSLIYFKLFTELEEDRRQFKILQDIGMTASEVRKVISKELRVLFFLPYIVGVIHSVFALIALYNLSKLDISVAGAMICAVYFVLQYGYYQITRLTYLKRLSLR